MIHSDPHEMYTMNEIETIMRQLVGVEQGLMTCRVGEVPNNVRLLKVLYNLTVHAADKLMNGYPN